MKTKITLLLIAVCFAALHTVAQTDYVINGSMTGTTLNYVNQATSVGTPSAGTGWGAYFGGSSPYQALDIVSTTDPIQGGVIQISANTRNLGINSAANMALNARLVQRLNSTPVGSYRLKFKAKSITSDVTTLVVIVRSTASGTPAFVVDGYTSGSGLATGFVYITVPGNQTWADYYADFDLTRTASTFVASPTIATLTANQTPVIGFQLETAATGPGVMLDDVSFIVKSFYTALEGPTFNEKNNITAVVSGTNQIKVSNVDGVVSIYNSIGKLIGQKTAIINTTDFMVNGSGLYIISNGKNKTKVIL